MQRRVCAALCFAMISFALGPADAQIATATLLGVVRDQTGAALPGAAVTAKSAATGATRSAITDTDGRYRIAALDPGEYEVRVELASFKTVVRPRVLLTVGGTTEADVEMSLGPIAEQVTVATDPPLIEPARAELSRVVSTERQQVLADVSTLLEETVNVSGALLVKSFGRQCATTERLRMAKFSA